MYDKNGNPRSSMAMLPFTGGDKTGLVKHFKAKEQIEKIKRAK